MSDDGTLSNDVLQLVVSQRLDSINVEKTHKTARAASRPYSTNSTAVTRSHPGDSITTDADNLAKVIARRSRDIPISEQDLCLGNDQEHTIDYGPDDSENEENSTPVANSPQADDEKLPGAYAGTAGTRYGRIAKRPLPQHLLGDATCQPRQDSTSRTLDETDHLPIVSSGEDMDAAAQNFFAQVEVEKNYWRRAFLLIGIICLVLAVVIPIIFRMGSRSSNTSTVQDSQEKETLDDILLVPNMTNYTLAALKDPFSYQSRAYELVETDRRWDELAPFRQQQRFAVLCVLYSFSMAGYTISTTISRIPSWRVSGVYSPRDHECSFRHIGCDETGRVTTLNVSHPDQKNRLLQSFLAREVYFLTHLQTIDFTSLRVVNSLDTLLPLNDTNSFPSLKELILPNCEITGSIPSSLGLLSTLTKLDLRESRLTGTIPSQLGLLTSLTTLLLAGNELSGTLPMELGNLSLLTQLSVEGNTDMDQVIPEEFCWQDHSPMELFRTNWCRSLDGCCSL